MVLENAKVIALTENNAFSVKKLLSVDDLTTNYLVYSPCVYNCPDDNWLLDVELYSEEFRADLISIWMDEMGLISNPAMRKQVKNYRAYFNAKDRRLKVSTQNKVPETPAQLHMAVMAAGRTRPWAVSNSSAFNCSEPYHAAGISCRTGRFYFHATSGILL